MTFSSLNAYFEPQPPPSPKNKGVSSSHGSEDKTQVAPQPSSGTPNLKKVSEAQGALMDYFKAPSKAQKTKKIHNDQLIPQLMADMLAKSHTVKSDTAKSHTAHTENRASSVPTQPVKQASPSLESKLLSGQTATEKTTNSQTNKNENAKVALSGELAKPSTPKSQNTETDTDVSENTPQEKTRPDGHPLLHPDRALPLPIATLTSAGRGVGRWFTDTAKALSKPENIVLLGGSALGLAALGAISAPAAATVAGALTIAGGVGAGVNVVKGVGKAIEASQKGEQGKDDYLYAIEDTAKASVDLGLSALGTKGTARLKQSKSLVNTEKRLTQISQDIAKLNQNMLDDVAQITPRNNQKLAKLLAEQQRLGSEAGRLKTQTLVSKLSQERSGLLGRESQIKLLDDQLNHLPSQSPARASLEKTRGQLEAQLTKNKSQVQALREELFTQANQNINKLQERLSVGQSTLKAPGIVKYQGTPVTPNEQSYRTLRQLMDQGIYVESQLKRSTRTLDELHTQLAQASQGADKHKLTQAIQQEEALQQHALHMHRAYSDVLHTLDQLDTTKGLLSQATPSPAVTQSQGMPWLEKGLGHASQEGKKFANHASIKALETQLNHQQAQLSQAYQQLSQHRSQQLASSGMTSTMGTPTSHPRIPTAQDAIDAYRRFKSSDVRLQKAQSQALGSDIDLHELTLQRNEALEQYLDLASNPQFKQAALSHELSRASEKQRRLENVEALLQGDPLRHPHPSQNATLLESGKAWTHEQLARLSNVTLNQPAKTLRQLQNTGQQSLNQVGLYGGESLAPYVAPNLRQLQNTLGDNQIRLADVRASLSAPTWQGKPLSNAGWTQPFSQPFRETWDAVRMPSKTRHEVSQRLNPFSMQHQPLNTNLAPTSPATNTLGKLKGSFTESTKGVGQTFERIGRYVQNRGSELGHWWQPTPEGIKANPWMIASSPLQPRTLAKGIAVGNGLEGILSSVQPTQPSTSNVTPSVPLSTTISNTSRPQTSSKEPMLRNDTATQEQELISSFSKTLQQLKAQGLSETEIEKEAEALLNQIPPPMRAALLKGLNDDTTL
jgi:hypothetical protein